MRYPLKRPLLALLLTYLIGLYVGFSGISFKWPVFLGLAIFLVSYVLRENMAFFFCLALTLIAGFLYSDALENRALAPAEFLGDQVTVEATIDAAPTNKKTVLMTVDRWQGKPLAKPLPVALKRAYQDDESYVVGARYAFSGALAEPMVRRNPGGFDQKSYLKSQGIHYVFASKEAGVYQVPPPFWQQKIHQLSERLKRSLDQHLLSGESTLAKAVLFGEIGLLNKDFYSLAQKMGLAHLFAVSGLHVGFMVGFVLAVAHLIGRKRSLVTLLAVTALVTLYALVVNLQPSVVRAGFMAVFALLLWQRHRYVDGLSLLTLAAWFIFLQNPYRIFAVGVQLSFIITLFLIIGMPVMQQLLAPISFKPLRDGLAASITAELGAFPLVAKYFSLWAPSGMVINLFVIPLFSLLIPLLLLGMFFDLVSHTLAKIFFIPAGFLLDAVAWFLYFLDRLPIRLHWYLGNVPGVLVIGFSGLLLFFYYIGYRHWGKKSLVAGALLLLLCGSFFYQPAEKQLRLHMMDTGQGSGALVQTATGDWLLFDAGPYEEGVAESMRALGINRLQAVVISHQDLDHIGGLRQVLRDFKTDYVLVPDAPTDKALWQPIQEMAALKKTEILPLAEAKTFTFQESSLSLQVVGKHDTTNGHQLICLYEDSKNKFKVLFAGDAGRSALNDLTLQGPTDILFVPHHGSRFALNKTFYQQMQPRCAFISAGVHNRFGHPHQEVTDFLTAANIPYYGTYEHGAISVYQKDEELFLRPYLA